MASQTPKKLFVDKNESAADLVERILSAREKNIIIVIPKDATFKKSIKNFHLLKSESQAAEKNILIESVDEEVLAFAGASAIEASHPLFADAGHRMSDIVPRASAKKVKEEVPEEEDEEVRESPSEREGHLPKSLRDEEEGRFFRDEDPQDIVRRGSSGIRRFLRSRSGKIVMSIVVIAVIGFFVIGRFAKATIALRLKHDTFSYEGNVTVTPQITVIAGDKDQIPGELFTNQKNFTQLFPATGHSDSSTKAKGAITIWNAYSSAAQTLVGATRFQTPDGKIFRLDKTVTVPGAHVVNGKITPSSIDAAVTADAPGSDSNVGAVAKLTVPGFKGTPRYDGFYGELKSGASGGGTGGKAVATPDDITQAKAKAQSVLAADLQSLALASVPDGFVIVPGASQVSISKVAVNSQTDDKGNFTVFAEATLQAVGFRESDLDALLLLHGNQNAPYPRSFTKVTKNYSQITPDFAHGMLTLHVQGQGDMMPEFSSGTFAETVAGRTENQARAAILDIPGLLDAKISLWPIWESQLPKDPGRIRVDVQ